MCTCQVLNDWFNAAHLDRKALGVLAANQAAHDAYLEHVDEEIASLVEGMIQALEHACPPALRPKPGDVPRAAAAAPAAAAADAGTQRPALPTIAAPGELVVVIQSLCQNSFFGLHHHMWLL